MREPMTAADRFAEAVRAHDWYHGMADCHQTWVKGEASYANLVALARDLDADTVRDLLWRYADDAPGRDRADAIIEAAGSNLLRRAA